MLPTPPMPMLELHLICFDRSSSTEKSPLHWQHSGGFEDEGLEALLGDLGLSAEGL